MTRTRSISAMVDGDVSIADEPEAKRRKTGAQTVQKSGWESSLGNNESPIKHGRFEKQHNIRDGQYTSNRRGIFLCDDFNQGNCTSVSNGRCSKDPNKVHQCSKCLSTDHPASECKKNPGNGPQKSTWNHKGSKGGGKSVEKGKKGKENGRYYGGTDSGDQEAYAECASMKTSVNLGDESSENAQHSDLPISSNSTVLSKHPLMKNTGCQSRLKVHSHRRSLKRVRSIPVTCIRRIRALRLLSRLNFRLRATLGFMQIVNVLFVIVIFPDNFAKLLGRSRSRAHRLPRQRLERVQSMPVTCKRHPTTEKR